MLISSCRTVHHKQESKLKSKNIEILLEFNKSRYSEFGIPTKNILPGNQFVYVSTDTFKINTDSMSIYLFMNRSGFLSFIYKEKDYKVKGQFYVPTFSEIGYQRIVNPETFIAETINVYDYKKPIRRGEWFYDDRGETTSENYNIVIDNSRIDDE